MRHRIALFAISSAITLALVGGCTDSTGGVAKPDGSDGSAGEQTGSPESPGGGQPTVEIPPRPADLPLDGVKPCTLFSQAQLKQLEITDPPTESTAKGHFAGLSCDLDIATVETFRSYEIVAVTDEGIEPWLTGKRNVEARLAEVAGFPAATYWFRGAEGNKTIDCATSVGVAEDQQLMVTADNDSEHSFTLDQLCQMAEDAAGMAMQTLQTLK